ncbi:Protein TOC75-3, chloroplastic [Dendrobium catenatum]|uniref:Protein TOC75-3, chloroplastic n=1 Tax=Dendrobium catenatum TaxID=906689 RepID=A0A2I0VSN4_9ASPA|nr:Protein TOC75-3, chloroplastic [Dendrobium catenatum]
MAFAQRQLLSSALSPAAPPRPRRPVSKIVSSAHIAEQSGSPSQITSSKEHEQWNRKKVFLLSVATASGSAVGGGFVFSLFSTPPPGSTGGGGGSGWGGGGGGGGGNGDSGGFWSRFLSSLSPPARAEEEKMETGAGPEWDSHGLPANIVVQLNKLSGLKRYKISDIVFFDRRRGSTFSSSVDSLFEMVSLRAGGVYTKAQIQAELETLASCGMFEKVDLEAKTKPDGTLSLVVSFTESTWQSADSFRCINVGLLPQTKQPDMDPDMTDREKLAYFKSMERDYRRRIERSRPCLLPVSVQKEVMEMLGNQGKVSARLLQKIRDRVQKWYHDEGYACAQVVNFGNLNTREVVCEVVEGDITQLSIQFQDKLGNICEGNTQLPVIRRELPKQLRPGHVFNIEAGKQALRNINSLALFSNIEVNPRPDEKNEGGIIVEIKLKELEQKSAEVSTEWNIVPGRNGRPTLASIQPGGTVTFEHRNIKGLNRSIIGSVTSSNLLNPQLFTKNAHNRMIALMEEEHTFSEPSANFPPPIPRRIRPSDKDNEIGAPFPGSFLLRLDLAEPALDRSSPMKIRLSLCSVSNVATRIEKGRREDNVIEHDPEGHQRGERPD